MTEETPEEIKCGRCGIEEGRFFQNKEGQILCYSCLLKQIYDGFEKKKQKVTK